MIQKLKTLILVLSSFTMMATPIALPVAVHAASTCNNNITKGVANGASNAATGSSGNITCTSDGEDGSSINALATKVVNIFSIIVGAVAIIMIIYGGFRYITSGGDSGNVGNAKNTLIYAIVGLVIVALAQVIVHFVLAQATTASTGL